MDPLTSGLIRLAAKSLPEIFKDSPEEIAERDKFIESQGRYEDKVCECCNKVNKVYRNEYKTFYGYGDCKFCKKPLDNPNGDGALLGFLIPTILLGVLCGMCYFLYRMIFN